MFLITKYRYSNTKTSIKQSNTLFFRLKIACHNAHIVKKYNRQQFKKGRALVCLSSTLYVPCIETKRNIVN